MTRTDQERILDDVFDGDAITAARAASLAAGLQALRRRHHSRVVLASATAVLVVATGLSVWLRAPATRYQVGRAAVTPLPAESPSVKMLNDAELLALFRDRPVALIGTPGEQRLIFLDESFAAASPAHPE